METLYKEIPDEIEITKQIDEISNGLGSKLPEPNSQLEYVIIIPAKDEAEGITQTLTAIANQKNKDGSDFNKSLFEILLLCHNCNDETFETCQEFARNKSNLNLQILELHSEVANTVGSARRILMNIASKRIQKTEGFIISTDADTLADNIGSLFNFLYYFKLWTCLRNDYRKTKRSNGAGKKISKGKGPVFNASQRTRIKYNPRSL